MTLHAPETPASPAAATDAPLDREETISRDEL
jgi:phenylacetate-CoA ligase